jgi:hypothetical protein
MKKRYDLNPLAFTFDHGFETEEAMENIRNAVEILGVDFLYFKSDYMKEMFSKLLNSGSKAVICHPCSIWYMDLAFDIAARYEIPMIVAGWTKGQSTKQEVMSKCGCNVHSIEFQAMAKETQKFLNEALKDMPKYALSVVMRCKKIGCPYDETKIISMFDELKSYFNSLIQLFTNTPNLIIKDETDKDYKNNFQ